MHHPHRLARALIPLLLLTFALASPPAQAQRRRRRKAPVPAGPRPLRIGVVVDGPLLPEWQRMLARTQKETKLLLEGSRAVSFPDDKRVDGGWDLQRIRAGFDRLLADPDVDLILTLGFLGPLDAARRPKLQKPVLAPLALDPRFSGLPLAKDGVTSGKPRFSYLVYSSGLDEDVVTFRRLVGAKKQHVLVDRLLLSWMPKIKDVVAAIRRRYGIELSLVAVDTTAKQALAALPADAKAVYLMPLPRLPDAQRVALLKGLAARRLPTFSATGRAEVERGALATQARGVDLLRAARRTAIDIERLHRGDKASSFQVRLERQRKLLLNMQVAQAIGWQPDWRVLVYAEKINASKLPRGRKLTLEQAVREALVRNWDVIAAQTGLRANRAQLKAAYGPLYPQVDFTFAHQTLREELAKASNGTQPWHQGKLAASLKQVLLVEPAFANVTIQKSLRRGQIADLRRVKLDVAALAARAFVDLLRARAGFELQRNNARLTDEYLDAAQVRRRIGTAGPTDVYRWQSKLASDRNQTVLAQTLLARARIQLNRLLRRPLTQAIDAQVPALWDAALVPAERKLAQLISKPARFLALSDFLVGEGLAAAPEAKRLRALIAAKQREALSRARALWMPRLQLQAEASYIPYRKFADTDPLVIPGLGQIDLALGQVPRFQWYVGLGLSLPLFTGLQQTYERDKARAEQTQLEQQLAGLRLGIETRIRAALNEVRARSAALHFTRIAARAARKNLKVVKDSYNRGVSSTVTLLDAQNSALAAELAGATATYDFHGALIELQRATGRIELFVGPQQRQAWFERLERYFKTHASRIQRFQMGSDGGLVGTPEADASQPASPKREGAQP